jgi:uncharacterized protein YneF (UPF0154 family)
VGCKIIAILLIHIQLIITVNLLILRKVKFNLEENPPLENGVKKLVGSMGK